VKIHLNTIAECFLLKTAVN